MKNRLQSLTVFAMAIMLVISLVKVNAAQRSFFDENLISQGASSKNNDHFFEDFEGAEFPPAGWSVYSQLDEAANWSLDLWQNITPGGTQSAVHNSATGEESVDNWLVTPQVTIPDDGSHYLSFWGFLANSWSYKSNKVLISTVSPDPADDDYVVVWDNASDLGNAWLWINYFVDLEDYIGQDVYLAFRYEGDTWGHTWNVDDVSLVDDSPVLNVSVLEVSQIVGSNGTGQQTFEINNAGIQDLTFDIELEYVNAEGWLTVDPLNETVASQASVVISIDFDAAGLDYGVYQANLTITSNDTENPTATVEVTFEVIDVNVYPFTEDFESETFPPIGWSIFNLEGEGVEWAHSWFNHTPGGQFSALHSYGWEPQDGWLVTPQISIPEEGFFYLSFWSMVGDAQFYEKNSVWVSTGSGNPLDEDFVEVWTVDEVTDEWTQYFIDMEEFAGEDVFIAFRYEGDFAHYWAIDDISLGEEVDDSPIMLVDATEIIQVVGEGGSGLKTFKVINDGIQNLTFDMEVEFTDGDNWLTAEPLSGSIPAKSSQTITLSFDASGLELGEYQANIVITGNDQENPEATVVAYLHVMEAQPADFIVIYPEYTFPTAISSDGMHVSGSQFGGLSGYLWTKYEGSVVIAGDVQGVADNGIVTGTYNTEFVFDNMEVETAGLWDRNTQQWQFLGMNPDVPEFFSNYYNVAYGISADGSVVAGMQWYPNFSVRAFRWTQADGYEMIGAAADYDSRANGISGDGSVIFGWATPNWGWTPAIWYNNEMILVDETQFGSASAASFSGNYVVGDLGEGAFIWEPSGQITTFTNTLNMGGLSPTSVLDDGTVFGYTAEGFPALPPDRRAFVRHPNGTMETFNEYVASRGWFDAADWIFFSVNDVTPDGNKFIGAAELPTGEWVSFMLDLEPGIPEISVSHHSLNEALEVNETSTQTLIIENTGTGALVYNALVQYTTEEPNVKQVPVGEIFHSGELKPGRKGTQHQQNDGQKAESKSNVLHYDGDNVDAVGLTVGGTFYGAARFPSELTSVYSEYTMESVHVYIGAIPSETKLIIWDAGTTTSPGSVLHEQVFTPVASSWNTVELSSPLAVSGSDIWIGFEITHEPGVFVLGIDGGPVNPNGDWISIDAVEWERLSDYGFNNNWNIRANLSFNGMDWLSIDPRNGIIGEGESGEMSISFDASGLENGKYFANIRINSNDPENSLVIIPVTLDVTSDDVSIMDIWEASLKVFPNPVKDLLMVRGSQSVERISMFNVTGQKVIDVIVSGNEHSINVSGLSQGYYILQVVSADGLIFNTRIMISR